VPETGAGLARGFHDEVVAPLLRRELPGVPLVAGRFGAGSDVLGFDDEVSRDHDWGLRLTVLVPQDAVGPVGDLLDRELPPAWAGHPVRFPTTWDPAQRHRVEVDTPDGFVRTRLGVGAAQEPTTADWLSFTGQAVLELLAGPVFCDDEGRWAALRDRFAWYPDDVWRHLVASAWQQLEQELPFVGRTGARGDDLGSRLITARLAGVAVQLGLLLDRVWAPYAKWVGTVFAGSPSGRVAPHLDRALAAGDWRGREAGLCAALDGLLQRQAQVGLPAPGPATAPFHDRPFRGVVETLPAALAPAGGGWGPLGVGAVGHWVDAVDVLVRPGLRRELARVVLGAEVGP
jgi:hypothetical protein